MGSNSNTGKQKKWLNGLGVIIYLLRAQTVFFATMCGKKIETGCSHTWTILDSYNKPGNGKGMISGLWYINRCTKCGVIERKDVF